MRDVLTKPPSKPPACTGAAQRSEAHPREQAGASEEAPGSHPEASLGHRGGGGSSRTSTPADDGRGGARGSQEEPAAAPAPAAASRWQSAACARMIRCTPCSRSAGGLRCSELEQPRQSGTTWPCSSASPAVIWQQPRHLLNQPHAAAEASLSLAQELGAVAAGAAGVPAAAGAPGDAPACWRLVSAKSDVRSFAALGCVGQEPNSMLPRC
ncbi:hypothetical protein PLESTF_000054200 [Pleodorina starrii]|nr:hypothetical protein PLESTF_000054200 [Pleodorina starrii]